MLENKTKVKIVFSSHNIEGYIDDEDFHNWINGEENSVLRVYLPAQEKVWTHETFFKVNARNVDYIEEIRHEK